MTGLSIIDSNLIVTLDDNHKITNIINFLRRKKFILRKEVWIIPVRIEASTLNYNVNLIRTVQRYIENRFGAIQLDDTCERIIQDFDADRQNFENQRTEAERIKETDDNLLEKIPVSAFGNNPDTGSKWELKQFQKKSVMHGLALKNSANFSVPGAGKTWMAFATYFLARDRHDEPAVDRLLVICPKAAFEVWENEYELVTGNNHTEYVKRLSVNELESGIIPTIPREREIILINYDLVREERYEMALVEMLRNYAFYVILDESHKIKNKDSSQGGSAARLAEFASRRMILTGTPMPNFEVGLWNQFNFLFPNRNILGSYEDFKQRVGTRSPAVIHDIADRLNPYFTRVTDNQLDLPPVFDNILEVPMSPEQQEIYDVIERHVLDNDGNRRKIQAYSNWEDNMTYAIMASTDPSLFSDNHQYTNNLINLQEIGIEERVARYTEGEHSGKIDTLYSYLRDHVNMEEEKIIIWYNYRGTGEKIQTMIENQLHTQVRKYDGSPESIDAGREQSLQMFRRETGEDKVNVLIANPASLAESVSLHKTCHHAIYVDRTFNATHWIQSKKRIHRVGMPNVNTKYTILKSVFSPSSLHRDVDTTVDREIEISLNAKEEAMNGFLDDPGITVNETTYSWNDPPRPGDEQDYRGLMERIRRRLTNDQPN